MNAVPKAETAQDGARRLFGRDIAEGFKPVALHCYADAEGVALWACDADAGYWIAVDQLRPTVFRLYDRKNLELVKTFSGKVVANTDGQVLYAVGTPRFPAGALYALHDDKAVAAFDLRDLVKVLGLSGRCMQ